MSKLLLIFLVPKASQIPRARKKLVEKCKRWNDHQPRWSAASKLLWSKIALN